METFARGGFSGRQGALVPRRAREEFGAVGRPDRAGWDRRGLRQVAFRPRVRVEKR